MIIIIGFSATIISRSRKNIDHSLDHHNVGGSLKICVSFL